MAINNITLNEFQSLIDKGLFRTNPSLFKAVYMGLNPEVKEAVDGRIGVSGRAQLALVPDTAIGGDTVRSLKNTPQGREVFGITQEPNGGIEFCIRRGSGF
jgi:hypothetical protein